MWEKVLAAINEKNLKFAKDLLDNMSPDEISRRNDSGETLLMLAVKAYQAKICELLINRMDYSAINAIDNQCHTALMYAEKCHMDSICRLIIPKMNSYTIDPMGRTTLILAIRYERNDICEQLIPIMDNEGINTIDDTGRTALLYAAANGMKEIGEQLIPKMSTETIGVIDDMGRTALMCFEEYFDIDAICRLIIPKINNNAIDPLGRTKLMLAANYKMEEICEQLIPIMSDEAINIIDNTGHTALTYAIVNKMDKVCELLIPLTNSKAINAVDNQQYSALTWAIAQCMEKICELLIPKMSSEAINNIDDYGRTALTYAINKKMGKICKLLAPLTNSEIFQNSTALTSSIACGMDDVGTHLIFLSNQKTLDTLKENYSSALSIAINRDMILLSKMLISLTSVETIRASKIYKDGSFKILLEYTEQHGKLSLYKMLFAKVHSSYESAFGDSGETKTDIIESVKKSIFQLADFIIKSFANPDSNEQAEIKFEDFGNFKFYQQINRDLLKSCIDHLGENGASLLKKIDTYIAVKYFTIAGITQSINLPEDPANHVFSFLEFPSLLAINTYEANAVGITSESNFDVSWGG